MNKEDTQDLIFLISTAVAIIIKFRLIPALHEDGVFIRVVRVVRIIFDVIWMPRGLEGPNWRSFAFLLRW
jgi:hypothetical protein